MKRLANFGRRVAAVLLSGIAAAVVACGASPQRGEGAPRTPPVGSSTDSARVASTSASYIQVHFDLAAASATVVAAGTTSTVALPDTALGQRLADFQHQLAQDQVAPWSEASRRNARLLGRALLHPITHLVRSARAWQVSPVELAPLGAVIAPWSAADDPLQASVILWYSPQTAPPTRQAAPPTPSECVPPPEVQATMPRNDGILAIAPFTPGATPGQDDPDTTLWLMRRTARNVDLIPRNDTSAGAIDGALRERRYGLTWLRAQPVQAMGLVPSLDRGPLLLWWTLPDRTVASVDTVLSVARGWLLGPAGIALDLWPRSQHVAEPGTAAFLRALREGAAAPDAVHAGVEALRLGGAPAAQWAGWIYIGNPGLTAQLLAPGWLQRGRD